MTSKWNKKGFLVVKWEKLASKEDQDQDELKRDKGTTHTALHTLTKTGHPLYNTTPDTSKKTIDTTCPERRQDTNG